MVYDGFNDYGQVIISNDRFEGMMKDNTNERYERDVLVHVKETVWKNERAINNTLFVAGLEEPVIPVIEHDRMINSCKVIQRV